MNDLEIEEFLLKHTTPMPDKAKYRLYKFSEVVDLFKIYVQDLESINTMLNKKKC